MSTAIVVPAAFQQGGPATIFQGQGAGDDLAGGITGGYGLIKFRGKVWSILYNGNSMNLMRDDGDGPRGSIDVVILKANPQLSKTFYLNGWDENNNNPPDCASANGLTPDQGVPHPQSPVCATCPRNAWGSAPNGGKGKACGDHRRMAVVPLSDLRNETFGGPLLLRCPAASLQDMAAFDSRYKGMGYPYFTMGIKIGFDPAESYPKFTFAAIRPLNDQEGAVVMELRNSPETARVVHEGTAAAPAQVAQVQQPAFLEAAPAQPMVQPQQVQVQQPVAQQPAATVAAAPVAQPVQNPVVQPAANVAAAGNGGGVAGGTPAPAVSGGGFGPAVAAGGQPAVTQPAAAQPGATPAANGSGGGAGVSAAPAGQAGGFGPATVQPAAAQPAAAQQPAAQTVQQPAAAAPQTTRPQVAMTGFGAVTPEVTAQPAQQVQQPAQPVQAAPVSPGTVSAFEGSIDDRLNQLLANT